LEDLRWSCNHAVWKKFTDILEENAASILWVQEKAENGRKCYGYGGKTIAGTGALRK
jgi:hypothetical protein